ncbi:MAG: nucleotidyltransferase domain-containing protein [Terriglobia bacterium]
MAPTSPSSFQPTLEQQLVLALLGNLSEARARGDIRGLLERVSWSEFLRVADPVLFPYLYGAMDQHQAWGAIPNQVHAQLARTRTAAIIRHMRQRKDLRDLLQLLGARGISVIVLKGAALAYLVYPDSYKRQMSDFDLLLSPSDVNRAEEAVRAAGFIHSTRFKEKRPWHDQRPIAEIGMFRSCAGLGELVEIHGALCSALPPFRHDTERIWQRSRQVTLYGLPVRVLHPHDFLIHICVHLSFKHVFSWGLRGLLDIRLCLEKWEESLDWDQLAAESVQQGSAPFVSLTLRLARDLLRARVPESFLNRFPEPRKLEQIKSIAWDQIWLSNLPCNPSFVLSKFYNSHPLRDVVAATVRHARAWVASGSSSGHGSLTKNFAVRSTLRRFWWDVKSQAYHLKTNLRNGGFSPTKLRIASEIQRRCESFKKLTEEWECARESAPDNQT